MSFIKEVVITEEQSNYIQQLTYERDGYKNIITSILEVSEFKYNKEMYDNFMKEYQFINTKFNLAINELKILYCNEYKNKDIEVKVFFDNNVVQFSEVNSCQYHK